MEAFAAEGAKVAVLARGRPALDETVAALLALGASDAVPVQADITDAQEVAGAFGIVEDRWGILNVLVNATGPLDVGVGRFAAVDERRRRRPYAGRSRQAQRAVPPAVARPCGGREIGAFGGTQRVAPRLKRPGRGGDLVHLRSAEWYGESIPLAEALYDEYLKELS
jgi:NAD(P)-dependent dehydrogenase (short-subunit alcohol dehydrogenase family)